MEQVTINFDAGLVDSYSTCREYVATRVHQQSKMQKIVAADMDLSPSQLSRKLAQSPNDTMRLTLDDFERYVTTTGDTAPVKYLVEKYLYTQNPEQLLAQIAQLQSMLNKNTGAAQR